MGIALSCAVREGLLQVVSLLSDKNDVQLDIRHEYSEA